LWERLQPRQLPHLYSIASGFTILPFRFASSFINCAIAVIVAIVGLALNTIAVRVIIETMLTLTTWHSRCCISGSNPMLTPAGYRSRRGISLITFEHSGLIALASRIFIFLNGARNFFNFRFVLDFALTLFSQCRSGK